VKKRVLQLIPSFHSGGSERQAICLTHLLQDEGSFEVMAATLNKEGVLLKDFVVSRDLALPEYKLNSFYDGNFIRQLRLFAQYLTSNRVDLIHTHDFYTNVFGMAAATLARTGVRIASKRESEGLRSGAQNTVEKIAFGRADAILVNSRAVHEHLANTGVPKEKMHLVYNGTEIEKFANVLDGDLAVENSAWPENARLITLVANLRLAVKNVPMMIRAAKQVCSSHADAHFLVAGEGELEPELRRIAAEFDVTDRVHFIGRCDNVPALLNASYACVLTSTAEGFSNSLIEYMAAGKPVVATNVGGASEAIQAGLTGFIVESGDDTAMAQRLVELLDDEPKAREMGEAGRAVAVSRFSVRSQLSNIAGLYDRYLEK
jgi:glycosyltransferase involved in cell wall biosynthesis